MTGFLLDTNCFIQIVRSRPHAPEVQALLQGVPLAQLCMTDFTLHSIGVVMSRFSQLSGYTSFLDGMGINRGFGVISVGHAQLQSVVETCTNLKLDFDDAYQYVAAEINGLKLVSLDVDFDRTPLGRLTPKRALELFTEEQRNSQQDA